MRHKHNLSCLEGNCPSPSRRKSTSASTPRPAMASAEAARHIRNRIDDEELRPDEFQVRRHYAPVMSTTQIGSLIHELDRRVRTERDRTFETWNRDEHWKSQDLVWRLNVTVRGLRDALKDRQEDTKRTRLAEGAATAATTGRETCACGQRHPYGANFYVSVQDAGRTGLLRGPFKTHAQAIAAVPKAKRDAEAVNSRAVFYSFGTVAMPHGYQKPGTLDG